MGWQGEYMEHEGRNKGEPSGFLPATAFVSYVQNHDQVGNRPFGDRLNKYVPLQASRTLAAMCLLSPQIPLLFMGEEWAAKQPFLFFSDMQDLGDAIRQARNEELKDAPGTDDPTNPPPDPMSEEAFLSSKLSWDDIDDLQSRRQMSLYKRLLDMLRREIVPRLYGMQGNSGRYEMIGSHGLKVWWTLGDGSTLTAIVNLSAEPLNGVEVWAKDHFWLEGFASGNTLDPWSAVFQLTPVPS